MSKLGCLISAKIYNVFFWNSAILLYWLAYDVCRNVFFGFCTPLLLETRKLGLVKWQVLLCFIMPLTSCYLDGSSFCLVSSMVWHKILSNNISLEFLILFTIAGYHNEYGLVKFQSSYWKRCLIGEISRMILMFFLNDCLTVLDAEIFEVACVTNFRLRHHLHETWFLLERKKVVLNIMQQLSVFTGFLLHQTVLLLDRFWIIHRSSKKMMIFSRA